jgi:hypothetical protein
MTRLGTTAFAQSLVSVTTITAPARAQMRPEVDGHLTIEAAHLVVSDQAAGAGTWRRDEKVE